MSERQVAATNKKASAKEKSVESRVLTTTDLSAMSDAKNDSASVQDFAVWVRVLRQNWRQGTVGCKGRSDVARTNKKPWKQKGTGRARAGSARSPLWRGGGVTFGPQMRTRTLTLSKKQRRGVMRSLLQQMVHDRSVISLAWKVEGDRPSTAYASKIIQNGGLDDKRLTLFVRPDDHLAFRSFRNLRNVSVISFDQPNAYHLAMSERWLVLDKDIEQFNNMVAAWN